MCTAEEGKLAGGPGGRKGWSRRQAERAAEMLQAIHTSRKQEEIKRQSTEGEREREEHASQREGVRGIEGIKNKENRKLENM